MPVTVTIEASCAAELHGELLALLGKGDRKEPLKYEDKLTAPVLTPETVDRVMGAEPVPAAEVVEMPKRRGRPAKAAEPAPVVEDVQPVAEEPAKEEPAAEEKTAFTPDDIKAVIGQIRDTKGLEIARQLLADFGGKKMSDISPDDYPAFMVKAQTYLEG